MKKILWVGDAGCPSGFARVTHESLKSLAPTYDVTVLGLNYQGDPHEHPYPIYAANVGGDYFGVGRLIWMCDLVKETEQSGAKRVIVPREQHSGPDLIIIQNDPWNFPHYLQRLRSIPEYRDVPTIGIIPVDGKDCLGSMLNGLTMAAFLTQFGLEEARRGGYKGPAVTIPNGVDLGTYYPEDKIAARRRRGLPPWMDQSFIVGNVNRNQPRKRWDLTLKYFAEWVHSGRMKDTYLYLHVAPTGDMGVDVKRLAMSYDIIQRLILVEPPTFYGATEDSMRDTYNCFDVQISTTQGEGFGLTTFEGMACGVPQIVPDWSALGELCQGAARLVPCTSTAIGPPYVNVLGGVADQAAFIKEMDALYVDDGLRAHTATLGFNRALEDRFRWENIGEAYRLIAGLLIRQDGERRARQVEADKVARAEAERVAWGMGGESNEEMWADLGRSVEVTA